MQDPLKGVPIKTVSTFMYKIPSVFSGKDVIIQYHLHFLFIYNHRTELEELEFGHKIELILCI